MNIQPDWCRTGTLQELRYDVNLNLKVGWNENKTDTCLITALPFQPNEFDPQNPKYLCQVWNRPGIRAQIAQLLAMDVNE